MSGRPDIIYCLVRRGHAVHYHSDRSVFERWLEKDSWQYPPDECEIIPYVPEPAAEPFEICPDCAGSGYSNHPDSGQVCYRCNGQGSYTRPTPSEARLREALAQIDALDPEGHTAGFSVDALRGLIERMGAIARAALKEASDERS